MGEGAQQALEVLDGLTRTGTSDLWMPPASATGGHHPTAWTAAHGEQQWRLEAELSFLTTSLQCSDCKSCEKLLT